MRPSPAATLDRAERAHSAAAALAVDAVTGEVVTAFDAAGIPSLLLKGPAVAAWLYDPSEVRPYVDVDLLVPADQCSGAENVLAGLGFSYLLDGVLPIEEVPHARTWVRATGPSVDLHTTLALLPAGAPHAWAAFSEGAGRLMVGGVAVAIPGPAYMALIVALHALQRGPDERQLVDELGRALEVAEPALWREAAAVATRLRAGGQLRAALGLWPRSASLADELGLPPVPVRAAILATATADARACALALDRIGANPSWRQKASLAVRLLVPTPSYLQAAGADRAGLVAGYRRRLARLRGARSGWVTWRSAVRNCGVSRRPTDRLEVIAWALAARISVAIAGPTRALRLLDRVRLRRSGGERLAASDRDVFFRLAGRCLGEAVARSEYLRVRGRPHELILGVAKSAGDFRAHAWLEPLDSAPEGFEVLHRFSR